MCLGTKVPSAKAPGAMLQSTNTTTCQHANGACYARPRQNSEHPLSWLRSGAPWLMALPVGTLNIVNW